MMNPTAIGKQSLLILLFCALQFAATAQYTPIEAALKLEYTSKIYFATGSYQLSENAIQSLVEILEKNDGALKIEYRLQAFTDDVGSAKSNEALAQQRAESVLQYLEEEGIATAQIHIKASQQLSLDPNQNAAAQRKENRRVEIECWLPSKKDELLSDNSTNNIDNSFDNDFDNKLDAGLQSFFGKCQKQFNQYFTFDAQKGTLLEGAKGTILQIPPDCFVDASGNIAIGMISFTLKEAYSMGDMLLQNLSTVSNGELLETGGSLFLAAQDATGKELSIRDGASITAAMASEEASLPNMQTFEGQLDANGNVENWNATGRLATSTTRQVVTSVTYDNYNNSNTAYIKSDIQTSFNELFKVPVWNQKMPKEMSKPRFRMREPKTPKLKTIELPSKNKLTEKIAQQTNESNLDYKKRINNLHKKALQVYYKYRNSNREKTREYKRDSLLYVQSKEKHEEAVLAYTAYNEKMRLVLAEMHQNADFRIQKYIRSHESVSNFFGGVLREHQRMKQVLENMESAATAYEAGGFDMRLILEKIKQTNLDQLTKEEIQQLSKSWTNLKADHIERKYYKNYSNDDNKKANNLNSYEHSVCRLFNGASGETELKAYKLRQIRKWKERFENGYNHKWLTKKHEEVQKVYEKRKALLAKFILMEDIMEGLQKAYIQRKNELKLFDIKPRTELITTEYSELTLSTAFRNALRIDRLGWMNCDRFYRNVEPRMNLEILANYDSNTAIYVVFKDVNGIMQMSYNKSTNSYVLYGVPRNQRIKIIGVHVDNLDTEVFVENGTVTKLNKVRPVFQKKALNEVRDLMAAT